MPNVPQARFMVRAIDDAALVQFMQSIEGDPDIALIDSIGPQSKPHTLVLSIAQDKAAALEAHVRTLPQLMLERDRPLSLF